MEKKFCAIYLSGTGNTKFCVSKLAKLLDENAPVIAIEDDAAIPAIGSYQNIILGYPVQFSNAPKMIRDHILKNQKLWEGKNVLCVATMGAFSGDGAGCAARILRKCGAFVLGGLHLKMPDSVCDSKLLKKSTEEKIKIIQRAEKKINNTVLQIKDGKFPQDGLSFFAHIAGLFGQRLWFYNKTAQYSDKLKIDRSNCIGCGNCVRICPMKNLSFENGTILPYGKCTMCYRCISQCPQKAITLVGNKIVEQYRIENLIT